MYCLTKICYVCLKKKNNLISSVNSSPSVKEELRRIIDYHAFNQPWLKTKRVILTCEECYSLLCQTYQFLKMWHKNTALLKGYIDLLNTTPMPNTGNEAELHVHVNMKETDINDVKREVKLEDEQIYTFQWEHDIEETEDTLVNLEDSFVKEENTWKREEVDVTEECPTDNNSTEIIDEANDVFVNLGDSFVKEDNKRIREEVNNKEEYPMGNNCTQSIDNESDSGTSINENSHLTNTDSVFRWQPNIEESEDVFVDFEETLIKAGIICKTDVNDKQEYPMGNNCAENIDNESVSETSINDSPHLTNTDSASSGFAGKQMHATNTDDLNTATKESYNCSTCSKSFITKTELNVHARVHTKKKSFECAICKKRLNRKENLVVHMRVHTGEKPYKCTTCKKIFTQHSNLVRHMRTHTGEKPFECATCKKCYSQHYHLVLHMRTHTGDKPYECATCKKCFITSSALVRHMRTHTGDKTYECTTCKTCFTSKSDLVRHMLVHTGDKPYKCSKCSKCFRQKSNIKSHMRNKHPDEEQH